MFCKLYRGNKKQNFITSLGKNSIYIVCNACSEWKCERPIQVQNSIRGARNISKIFINTDVFQKNGKRAHRLPHSIYKPFRKNFLRKLTKVRNKFVSYRKQWLYISHKGSRMQHCTVSCLVRMVCNLNLFSKLSRNKKWNFDLLLQWNSIYTVWR